MRMRWRGLELPTSVILDEGLSTDTYGCLSIEPFERGFGTTVGNSLRRILLSSLEGSAVTSIKIASVEHEFTSMPGILEDITHIVLNVKSLIVKLDAEEAKTMRLVASKAGPVTADQIEADPAITVINPDQLLATLTEDVPFEMELTVERGRGYVPANEVADNTEEREVGVIPVDALYSPVSRVRYKTEETRVGQRTDYDRLIMEIWTDGTLGPEMALVESAKILRKHLGPFIQYFDLGHDLARDQEEIEEIVEVDEPIADEQLQVKLNMTLQEIDLSVRASNCLEAANIDSVGKLVQIEETKLLSLRSFGKTSMREIRRKLAALGLSLGMDIPENMAPRPPEIIEEQD